MRSDPPPQQSSHLTRDTESFTMWLGRRKTQIRSDWSFCEVPVAEHILLNFINTQNDSLGQLGQFDFRLSTSVQSHLKAQKAQLYALGFATDKNKLRRFLSPSILGLDLVTHQLGANGREMYDCLASRVQPADQPHQSLYFMQRSLCSTEIAPPDYYIVVTSTGYMLRKLFAVASRYQHTIKEVCKVIEFLYRLVIRWNLRDEVITASGFATRQELRDFPQEFKPCASKIIISTTYKLSHADWKESEGYVIWNRRRGAGCSTHNEQLTSLAGIIEHLRRQHKLRFISRPAALGSQDDHGNSWYCFSCTTRWEKDHRSFRSDRAMWDHLNAKHDIELDDIFITGPLI